jgi:FAD linked oxidases, C-terminal domain
VPWDKCEQLCINTKAAIHLELENFDIKHADVSCRVTQLYDAGACVYFYFAFRDERVKDPLKFFERIEDLARKTILASGEFQAVFRLGVFFFKKSVNQAAQYRTITGSGRFDRSGTNKASLTSELECLTQQKLTWTRRIFLRSEIWWHSKMTKSFRNFEIFPDEMM